MAEMSDACGQDHAPGEYKLPGLGGECESFGSTRYESNVGLFEIGDETPLKLEAVSDKGIEWNRIDHVGVREAPLLAEVGQGEGGTRIVETGSEAKRFEESAGSHVISPAGHRGSEDPEGHTAGAQVGSNGEAIGACSDDRNVNSLACQYIPFRLFKFYIVKGRPVCRFVCRRFELTTGLCLEIRYQAVGRY